MDSKQEKRSLIEINDTKAGMEGLDKEKINQMIKEISKDSPFYKHQLEREKRIDSQTEKMIHKWSTFSDAQKASAKKAMDKLKSEYEMQAKNLSQIIVHIDMDMFFAAVEMRDNPELREKPMAVGSFSMISTSNYVARRFGVRAGMAGFVGKKLCPQLVLIKGSYSKYSAESKKIMSILRNYDPDLCIMGCDEAYLNLTPFATQRYLSKLQNSNRYESKLLTENEWSGEKILKKEVWDEAAVIVEEIRKAISEKVRLTSSAGISTNTMLAKICSDLNKPNGQHMLPGLSYEFIANFVENINIRKIPGIGPVQERVLKAFKIETCKDLWEKRDMIYLLFKPASIDFYVRVALGLGSGFAKFDDDPRKSIGSEVTFKSTNDVKFLNQKLLELSKEVSDSLIKYETKGRTITLKYKKETFEVSVRSKTLSYSTSDSSLIYSTAVNILKTEMNQCNNLDDFKLRLIGIRVSNLTDQLTENKKETKQQTLDQFINKKMKKHEDEKETDLILCQDFDNYEYEETSEEYICTFCSQSFKKYPIFEHHVDLCTQSFSTQPSQSTSQSEFACPACNKVKFSTLVELNGHLDVCLNQEDKNV